MSTAKRTGTVKAVGKYVLGSLGIDSIQRVF